MAEVTGPTPEDNVPSLTSFPFKGLALFGHRPIDQFTAADRRLLIEAFKPQLRQLLPYLDRYAGYAYIPLDDGHDGYHVSFQGRLTLDDLLPYFSVLPNAMVVLDGRAWGYLRFQLLRLDEEGPAVKVAEIEVYLQGSKEAGFELFWAPEGRSPVRHRFYGGRDPQRDAQVVQQLVRSWGTRYRLARENPDLWRGEGPGVGPFADPVRDRRVRSARGHTREAG